MSLHRFYVPPAPNRQAPTRLTGAEAHHALRVLRLRRGDRLLLLDGAGQEYFCEVRDSAKDLLELTLLEHRSTPPPPYQLTLLQAIPKGKLFESIIQKATELGAARIMPVLSERVVTHLDAQGVEHKAEKWQQVAIEAIKQCGSRWLPQVEAPVTPAQFLARREGFDLPLVASLQPGSKHPREYFRAFQHAHGHKPQSVCVWVGPEGDFTPEEVQSLQAHGAQPITLGPLVLRAETAAVYCLSVLNYELQAPDS